MIKKLKKATKRTKIIIGIVLVIILIIVGVALKKKESSYELGTVVRSDVIQEVSATGTVEAAEEVDLRFKTSGIIESINAKVGQEVFKGSYLARLSSGDVYSQFLQAQASYNQARAKLDQLLAGATDEEIRVAERVLENARISFEDTKDKAENDLQQDYNSALVYLIDASSKCNKALADLQDMEKNYFYYNNALDNIYKDKRTKAEDSFNGTSIIKGAKEYVDDAETNPTHQNIDLALIEMRASVQKFIDALDYAKTAMADPTVKNNVSSTDRTTIDTDITNTNSAYSNINTAQTDIANQKITNQININTAEATYNKAKVDLEKLEAPPRNVDIAVYQADVDKYGANMNEYSQKLRDASIIAPFNGVIAKLDGKVGEVVSVNDKVIVSLIAPKGFQIKADISEADISKVDSGDSVKIVLDAFPEEIWLGQIVEIDPAETVIEGVVYYRVKILFEQTDERIRSGMTGDTIIETDKKENVLTVPYRAIIFRENERFVRILDRKEIREIEVKTGLRGSKGEIEIVGGLEEGQEIITFIKSR